jgi:hypothetical protein
MNAISKSLAGGLIGLTLATGYAISPLSANPAMSFFLTSVNPGKGADLGGLAGADQYCQRLAASVGAGGKTWKAYLSATASGDAPLVNARDRIGRGPWQNVKGEVIAKTLEDLHGANHLSKQTALTETGLVVSGRGDAVNQHDVLTGSNDEGRLAVDASAGADTTCGNWTKSGEGSAMVGHHDRIGLNDTPSSKSWNASHASRGCGMAALKSTGGAGLFYCFAIN